MMRSKVERRFKMSKKEPALFEKITRALQTRDEKTLVDLVTENQKALSWADVSGKNLAHYAVALHADILLKTFMTRGGDFTAGDQQGVTPLDVARALHRTTFIDILETAEKNRPENKCPDYTSLADIRKLSADKKTNLLYLLVQQGQLLQILAVMEKNQERFSVDDLLSVHRRGRAENVLLAICRQGEVTELFKQSLWIGRVHDFETVLKKIPKVFLEGVNVTAFHRELRRKNIQSGRRRRRSGLSS